jgi:oligopeptide/dipeptide ABC transporter ATP-binding protein
VTASPPSRPKPLITVERLTVDYEMKGQQIRGANGVELILNEAEAVALVGESGSGKTTTAMAIAGLLPPNARIRAGVIKFRGALLPIDDEIGMRRHRWLDIAVVFQGAMNSLNPVHRIADQIAEPLMLRQGKSRAEAYRRVRELLEMVGIPPDRGRAYPHELSGGMRQRAIIAMALSCNPAVVIGDEPTTALDVITQAQILALLRDLRSRLGVSLLLITHDLSLVAETCNRVIIMYAGQVVEEANVSSAFSRPLHPYTRLLLETVPNPASGQRTIRAIPGDPPDMRQLPGGCAFHPRCPHAMERCRQETPLLKEAGDCRVACHLYDDVAVATIAAR